MTLPASRNTNYTPASPVKSQDLNDIQDCIIGGKCGDRTLVIGAAKFVADGGNGRLTQAGNLTVAGAAICYAPIELFAGCRIKTVTVFYNPNNATMGPPKLQRMNLA